MFATNLLSTKILDVDRNPKILPKDKTSEVTKVMSTNNQLVATHF